MGMRFVSAKAGHPILPYLKLDVPTMALNVYILGKERLPLQASQS
jgi:hypothetical protein